MARKFPSLQTVDLDYLRPTNLKGKPRSIEEKAVNRRRQRNNENLRARGQEIIPKFDAPWTPAIGKQIASFVEKNINLDAPIGGEEEDEDTEEDAEDNTEEENNEYNEDDDDEDGFDLYTEQEPLHNKRKFHDSDDEHVTSPIPRKRVRNNAASTAETAETNQEDSAAEESNAPDSEDSLELGESNNHAEVNVDEDADEDPLFEFSDRSLEELQAIEDRTAAPYVGENIEEHPLFDPQSPEEVQAIRDEMAVIFLAGWSSIA